LEADENCLKQIAQKDITTKREDKYSNGIPIEPIKAGEQNLGEEV
jgi:hypothetical protein